MSFPGACLRRSTRPWVERILVSGDVEHGRIVVEGVLRSVAVVDIEIDDSNAVEAVRAAGQRSGDRDAVEDAEAHRLRRLGMMPRRADKAERGLHPLL